MNDFKDNLGVIEFKSIARGIYTTDSMLKEAAVSLVLATTLCPGKYLTVVGGNVSAVEKAVSVAKNIGAKEVYSARSVNSINKAVTDAIGGVVKRTIDDSISIIESQNMACMISAADISLDTAEVEIVELRLGKGCGANSFFIITGQLSAVEEATGKAVLFLQKEGSLIAFRIVKNPDRDILKWLEPSRCMC
jgi:microcompartment protein CcmL/EutN